MARPRSTPGGRPVVVAVRLSETEAAHLDNDRGSLDRGAFLRYVLLLARKQGVTLATPVTDDDKWAHLSEMSSG